MSKITIENKDSIEKIANSIEGYLRIIATNINRNTFKNSVKYLQKKLFLFGTIKEKTLYQNQSFEKNMFIFILFENKNPYEDLIKYFSNSEDYFRELKNKIIEKLLENNANIDTVSTKQRFTYQAIGNKNIKKVLFNSENIHKFNNNFITYLYDNELYFEFEQPNQKELRALCDYNFIGLKYKEVSPFFELQESLTQLIKLRENIFKITTKLNLSFSDYGECLAIYILEQLDQDKLSKVAGLNGYQDYISERQFTNYNNHFSPFYTHFQEIFSLKECQNEFDVIKIIINEEFSLTILELLFCFFDINKRDFFVCLEFVNAIDKK